MLNPDIPLVYLIPENERSDWIYDFDRLGNRKEDAEYYDRYFGDCHGDASMVNLVATCYQSQSILGEDDDDFDLIERGPAHTLRSLRDEFIKYLYKSNCGGAHEFTDRKKLELNKKRSIDIPSNAASCWQRKNNGNCFHTFYRWSGEDRNHSPSVVLHYRSVYDLTAGFQRLVEMTLGDSGFDSELVEVLGDMRALEDEANEVDLQRLATARIDPDYAYDLWVNEGCVQSDKRKEVRNVAQHKRGLLQQDVCASCALTYQKDVFSGQSEALVLRVIDVINRFGGLDPLTLPQMKGRAKVQYQSRRDQERKIS